MEEDEEVSMRQKYKEWQVQADFEDGPEPLNYSKFIFPPD